MYRLRTLCLRVSDGSHFHGGENRDGSSSQRLHSRHPQQDRGGKVDLPAKAEVNLKFLPSLMPKPSFPANLPGTGPIQGKNRRLRMRIQFPPSRILGEPPSSSGELRFEGLFLKKLGVGKQREPLYLGDVLCRLLGRPGRHRVPSRVFLTILPGNRDIIPCRSPEKLV